MTDSMDTARLDAALSAVAANSGDDDAAAAAALELGALCEGSAPSGLDERLSGWRGLLVRAVSQQHGRHGARLTRSLEWLADHSELLSAPAVLTDDPDAAEHAQRRALGALSSREALHRLEACASFLGAPPLDELVTSRQGVDARLAHALSSWTAIAHWRTRFLEDLQLDEARLTRRPWLATWPAMEADIDGAEELELAPVLSWLQSRASDGRLRLTREEATALLSTERGRSLASQLDAQLDLSALEPSPEAVSAPQEVRREATPNLLERMRTRIGEAGRALVDNLVGLLPPATSEVAFAATGGDGAAAELGFSAIARFHAMSTELVEGVGLVSVGRLALGASVDAPTQRAVLVLPAADVRALALGDGDSYPRSSWQPGAVAWLIGSERSISLRVDRETAGDAQVSLDLDEDAGDSFFSVAIRAITMSSVEDVLSMLSAAREEGDEHVRAGCAILEALVAPRQ